MRPLNSVVVDPRSVAVARIGLGFATILNAIEMFNLLTGIAGGRIAMPVFAWMPAPTMGQATMYLVAAVATGAAITIGYRTTGAAIVSTLLSGWVFLWDQQTYSSHRWLALLLVTYLIFSRPDTAWSWTSSRLAEAPAMVPWWPQLLMMTQLSVCYLFAGLSKNNLTFLSGGSLGAWIRWEFPEAVLVAMAFGTVLTEVFVALGLWARQTRLVAVVVGFGFHTAILVLIEDQTWALVAFALTCVSLYPLYFAHPRPALATKSGEHLAAYAAT